MSGFVFTLVLVGAILAADTDHPIFWLLIGPVPVAVLHTTMTLLRQRPEAVRRITRVSRTEPIYLRAFANKITSHD
jgi:hypothetical protein